MKKTDISFEVFKNQFISQFVFLPIGRPDFEKFLELHFKVYKIVYKNIYTVEEYAKIALHEELNEFEIYGMQLKETIEKNPNYFNGCLNHKDIKPPLY